MAKKEPFWRGKKGAILDAHFGCSLWLLKRKMSLLAWDSATGESHYSTFIPASNITVITFSVSMTALALVLSVTFVYQFMTFFLHNLASLGLATFTLLLQKAKL